MPFAIKARAQYTPRMSSGQFVATKITPGAIAAANGGARRIVERAQDLVHIRSGELHDSGGVVEAEDNGKTAVAQAVFTSDHAAYNEFGTGRRGESSPMAGKGPYNTDVAGMEPIPFLRPALDDTRAQVKDEFVSELSISLRS